MDAIELLTEDHEKARELFRSFDAETDDAAKEAIAEKLCRALRAHMRLEEELFYPAARRALPDDGPVDEAEREHALAKKIIGSNEDRDPGFVMDVQVRALRAAVGHHASEEEDEMFPKLRAAGMETDELGERMLERKGELEGA